MSISLKNIIKNTTNYSYGLFSKCVYYDKNDKTNFFLNPKLINEITHIIIYYYLKKKYIYKLCCVTECNNYIF